MISLMKEFQFKGFVMNGFVMLFLHHIVFLALVIGVLSHGDARAMAVLGTVLAIIWFAFYAGYVQLEPNEAA